MGREGVIVDKNACLGNHRKEVRIEDTKPISKYFWLVRLSNGSIEHPEINR